MRLEATHRRIASLDVRTLASLVEQDLSAIYADPDSPSWQEVRRRSEFIDREDRPPDVAYRKMRPTGYMQLGIVNLEVPASPWALPLPAGLPHGAALRHEFDRIAHACREYYGAGLLHLMVLAALAPGGSVPTHKDMGHNRAWKSFSHHLHVPLIGSEGCEFTIDAETFFLEAGGVYEIDNMRPHSTRNLSKAPRVNLMIDYCAEANLAARDAALAVDRDG
jgi:hypothetical protein